MFGIETMHPLLVGILAVVGHMFPIFAGFRGGKAVATSGWHSLRNSTSFIFISYRCFFHQLKNI